MSKLRSGINLLTTAYLASDMTLGEFKDGVLQLFKDTAERIIGESEDTGYNNSLGGFYEGYGTGEEGSIRNKLKSKQRQNLSKILSEDEVETEME